MQFVPLFIVCDQCFHMKQKECIESHCIVIIKKINDEENCPNKFKFGVQSDFFDVNRTILSNEKKYDYIISI